MRKLKRAEAESPAIGDQRIIAAVHLWLAPNPTLSVRQMAKATGLSQARFSHLFARTTGMLPGAFLRVLKKYQTERALAVDVLRDAGAGDDCVF